jgi:hypothetical protein
METETTTKETNMEIAPTGQDVWTLDINDEDEGTSTLAIYASEEAAVEALICEALYDAECHDKPLTRAEVEATIETDDGGNKSWSRPIAWTGLDWATMTLDIGRCPLLGVKS